MEGIVKWYNWKKGYGFVHGDDGEDYFVHFTQVPKGVRIFPEDRVSFEAADTEKGKQAQNLTVLQKAEQKPRPEREAQGSDDSQAPGSADAEPEYNDYQDDE